MKKYTLKQILNNDLGFQVSLITLSKIAFECGTTIASSSLIRPVKEIDKTVLSADDLRELALPQEFLNMKETQEIDTGVSFNEAMNVYNSALIRAGEILANEPANSWLLNDFSNIYDRIFGRLKFLNSKDSQTEERKANLSALSSFGDNDTALINVQLIDTIELAKIKERALNSYKEYQSLDNIETLRKSDSSDLDKIIEDYSSKTILPKVEQSILNLCKAYFKKPSFNLDKELICYGDNLNKLNS